MAPIWLKSAYHLLLASSREEADMPIPSIPNCSKTQPWELGSSDQIHQYTSLHLSYLRKYLYAAFPLLLVWWVAQVPSFWCSRSIGGLTQVVSRINSWCRRGSGDRDRQHPLAVREADAMASSHLAGSVRWLRPRSRKELPAGPPILSHQLTND